MIFEIAICDDCEMDRQYLKKQIEKNEKNGALIHFNEYSSGSELLRAMDSLKFSIIFLDIQMSYMDGEETAVKIRKIDTDVILVFNTGYAEPSLRSFEVQPYRYIKKNLTDEEKDKYISDVLEKMMEIVSGPVINAKCTGKKIYLKPNDIIYVEKCNKTTRAHISKAAMKKYDVSHDEEVRIPDKLINLYHILEPYGFGYPHDSYIINFEYLLTCTNKEFTLEEFENTSFKYTRNKALEFKSRLQRFMEAKFREKG